MKILIVDDSPAMRKIARRTLRQAGYESAEVMEADGAGDALAVLDRGPVDLIVSDLHMPGMDGLELVSRVRRRADGREVPIVIVTTEAGEEAVRAAMTRGASGYVVKPFTPEKLERVLERVLPS